MDITPLVPKGRKLITGYGGGGFKVNHEFVAGSLIVFGETALEWDGTPEALVAALSAVAGQVELLLIGSGKAVVLPEPAFRQLLREKGIAIDVMDTGAACRTYNVLLSEERKVAAAVVAV